MNTITYSIRRLFLFTVLTFTVSALPVSASQDIYLEIAGIEGEALDKGFEKTIQISAFGWGMYNAATTSTNRLVSGKAEFQDITFSKYFDSASPKLFARAAAGLIIPKAKLSVTKRTDVGARIPYLVIEMENVVVSSLQLKDSVGTESPNESGSLAFTKVTITHTDEKGKKTVESWDVTTRSK